LFYFSVDFSGKTPVLHLNGDAPFIQNEEHVIYTDKHFNENYPGITVYEFLKNENYSFLSELHLGFSIIFYNKKNHKLLVFRDLFGIKSLYFSQENKKITISDQIKPLVRNGKEQLNRPYIKDYLSFQISDQNISSETFFENIHRILPGHMLTGENGEIKQIPNEFLGDFKPNEFNFQEILSEKIKNITNKSGQVGSYLSGGLDSGLISILLNQNSEKYPSFYFKTDAEITEDEEIAEKISEINNFPIHKISPPEIEIETLKNWASKSMQPELMLFPAEIFAYIIKTGNQKILLSGHGGDTIAGDGLEYLEILFENGEYKNLKNSLFLYYSQKNKAWKKIGYNDPFRAFLTDYFLKKSFILFQKNRLIVSLKATFKLFFAFNLSIFDLFPRIKLRNIVRKLKTIKHKLKKEIDFAGLFFKNGTAHQNRQFNSNFIGLGIHALETFGLVDEITNTQTLYPLIDQRLLEISLFQSPLEKFAHGRGRGSIRIALEKIAPDFLTNRTGKGDFDLLIENIFKKLWDKYGKTLPEDHQVWQFADKNIYNKAIENDSDPIFTEKINKNDLWYLQRTMYLAIWLEVLESHSS